MLWFLPWLLLVSDKFQHIWLVFNFFLAMFDMFDVTLCYVNVLNSSLLIRWQYSICRICVYIYICFERYWMFRWINGNLWHGLCPKAWAWACVEVKAEIDHECKATANKKKKKKEKQERKEKKEKKQKKRSPEYKQMYRDVRDEQHQEQYRDVRDP